MELNLVPNPPPKQKLLPILAKDPLKIEIELFPHGATSDHVYPNTRASTQVNTNQHESKTSLDHKK